MAVRTGLLTFSNNAFSPTERSRVWPWKVSEGGMLAGGPLIPRHSQYFQRRAFANSVSSSKKDCSGTDWETRGGQASVKGSETPRHPVSGLETSMRASK